MSDFQEARRQFLKATSLAATHNRAGVNLYAGQYSGEVGPVYIEPKHDPGGYDREVFLVLKEFEPTFSRGGDLAQDFLSPATRNKSLEETGESAMKASFAKGMPHGYEVEYGSFTRLDPSS
jgi:hypothetical protein